MRVLLLGGFEPSGHDAHLEAMRDAFRDHGWDVTSWEWREMLPGLDDHPVFHLHRYDATPSLAALMGLPGLGPAFAADLWHTLPDLAEFDVVFSVHPWSSLIAAAALRAQGNERVKLVDCCTDYRAIPRTDDDRIDLHCGGLGRRAVPPQLWRRCRATGIPTPSRFAVEAADSTVRRSGVLCVSTGRLGQGERSAFDATAHAISTLAPAAIHVAGLHPEVPDDWQKLGDECSVVLVPRGEDLAPLWRTAEWVITKASGAALSEAFASHAKVIGYETEVPWEDTALSLLARLGALVPSSRLGECDFGSDTRWNTLAVQAADKAVEAVTSLCSGAPSIDPDIVLPVGLGIPARGRSLIPAVSEWLDRELADWTGT